MKNRSIWTNIKQTVECPKLEKDLDVDVLIIGGGISGISTAYHLINSNLNVCLVEKNTVGSGITSRTTGKLTYLQDNMYSKIKAYHGVKKAKLYLNSQIEAIKIVKNIIEKNKINCDLECVDSYVLESDVKKFEKEISILKQIDVPIKEVNYLPNNEKINKAYYVSDTYVFHPLKYLYSLKKICLEKNVSIYEHTNILSIEKEKEYFICKTKNNTIKTKYIVLAMHYPYFLFPFLMPLKAYIEKSYICAYEVEYDFKYSLINNSKPIISKRYHNEGDKIYELFLTNSHNTCVKNDEYKNFKNLLEKNNVDYLWSNQDLMTNDSLPFIGAINDQKTLFLATGYNTWGMTNGSISGKIISDIILNQENDYSVLFCPLRKINVGKVLNFPLIVGSNVCSFAKTKINKQKSWYNDNVRFEKRNGKDIAIYIDESGKEHIVYNLCPHLKCSLLFNEIEKTWDCPCHGSKFDIDGKCLEGPSNYDIGYKE